MKERALTHYLFVCLLIRCSGLNARCCSFHRSFVRSLIRLFVCSFFFFPIRRDGRMGLGWWDGQGWQDGDGGMEVRPRCARADGMNEWMDGWIPTLPNKYTSSGGCGLHPDSKSSSISISIALSKDQDQRPRPRPKPKLTPRAKAGFHFSLPKVTYLPALFPRYCEQVSRT